MINTEITIRSIQHYLYCPHRWGLIEINDCWAENIFVTKANFLHERVHDPDKKYSLRGKKVFTSVPIYNDLEQYNLYGVADCIEASKSGKGVLLPGYEDRYKLCIVEYKPSKPKNKEYNHDDLMQVFAQKICVDYLFNCDCDAVLYYADVKKRIPLPLRENFTEYDCELKELLLQIRMYISEGIIPGIPQTQNCSGCSLKDLCLPPKKRLKKKSIREYIKEMEAEDYEKTS